MLQKIISLTTNLYDRLNTPPPGPNGTFGRARALGDILSEPANCATLYLIYSRVVEEVAQGVGEDTQWDIHNADRDRGHVGVEGLAVGGEEVETAGSRQIDAGNSGAGRMQKPGCGAERRPLHALKLGSVDEVAQHVIAAGASLQLVEPVRVAGGVRRAEEHALIQLRKVRLV